MLSLLEFDRDQDVAYILLRPELQTRTGVVKRTVEVTEDVLVDFDADNQVVGIELLNASERLNLEQALASPSDLIVGVKEAAELAGVEKSNFIRDLANKQDFPTPVADLASGRLWLKLDVVDYLLQHGKGAGVLPTAAGLTAQPHPGSMRRVLPSAKSSLVRVAEGQPRLHSYATLTARARVISQFRKERHLLSLSAERFLSTVLVPLFVRQGLTILSDLGKTLAVPNSAMFLVVDQLGMTDCYAVHAHRGSINLVGDNVSKVGELVSNVSQLLEMKLATDGTSVKKHPAKVVLCVSGRANPTSRGRIKQAIPDVRLVLMDCNDLLPTIDERLPELWLDVDSSLPPYLGAVKNACIAHIDDFFSTEESAKRGPASGQTFVELTLHRTRFRPVKRRGRIEREATFEELPVQALLRRQERLVLIAGDAGSGKSTCLRRLAYLLADRSLKEEHPNIPVLLRAVDIWSHRPAPLIDVAVDYTRRLAASDSAAFSNSDLESGRVTFLIDALDELADDDARRGVAQLILEFHRTYPDCKVIATSREYAFIKSLSELAAFERFRLSPISYRQAEQILVRLQKSRSLSKEASKEVLRRLQDVHGMDLNPLLVTIFAATSDYSRRDIPANITELFKKFTEMMLGRWDAEKGLGQQYHAPLKDFILTRVAFEMHRRHVTTLSRDQFTEMIKAELSTRGHKADVEGLLTEILVRSGLFRISDHEVEFRHHLLQEFFAGRGIPSEDFLEAVIAEDWWQRPIVFFFGQNPSNHRGLEHIIASMTVRPLHERYRAAITVGLALQACYLVEVKEKIDIGRWVIDGLAASKDSFLEAAVDRPDRPIMKFVLYYIFGRDAVALSMLQETYEEILSGLVTEEMSEEERDIRMFWVITGLIESGALETAERLIKEFHPQDSRLVLAIHLGCFVLQHLKVATPTERRAAQRISERLSVGILPLRNQLLAEYRSELLEIRNGEVKAIDETEAEVGIP